MKSAEQIATDFRSGALKQDRIEIATYCGSDAAGSALKLLGITESLPPFVPDDLFKEQLVAAELHLPDWAEILAEHADPETCARASYAAAFATVDREACDGQTKPRDVLSAIRAHLLSPSDATRSALEVLSESFDDEDWTEHGLGDHGTRSLNAALRCALGDKSACIEAIDASGFSDGYDDDDDADQDVEARETVTLALAPWLIGDGDPLRDSSS